MKSINQDASMHDESDGTTHVRLIPFDQRRDLPQLRDWLHRPHVVRWWGDPDEVLVPVRRLPQAAQALIEADGRPVGYLCWQNPTREELATVGLDDLPVDLVDVDILIGESELLGRGIGPRAISLLLQRLRGEGVTAVGMGCAVDNVRALRAYAKAGFRHFSTFHEAGQEMSYLVWTADAPGQ